MTMNNLQRVRYRTTLNEDLLPNAVIDDLLAENTYAGVLDINGAIADAFDYMAAQDEAGGVATSFTRGPTSMTLSRTLRDSAIYYRSLSVGGGGGLKGGFITRNDYPPNDETEYGPLQCP